MKFAWTEKDKERFFKRAERQLKAAGIDFVQVDREQIGVKEWNAEKQTAGAVYVWLTSYPYNHFSTGQALELQQKPCKTRAGNKNNFRSCMVQIRANSDKRLLRGQRQREQRRT